MPLMSKSQYAKHRRENGLPGGSPPAVTYAIRDGRITINPKTDLIDSEVADRQWAENTSPAAQNAGVTAGIARAEQIRNHPETRKPKGGRPIKDPISRDDFAKARASKEFYEAELARLKFEEKQGTLLSAKLVKKVLYEAGRLIRNGHEALIIKIAPDLSAESQISEVERILKRELDELDNHLADKVAKLDDDLLRSESEEVDQAA